MKNLLLSLVILLAPIAVVSAHPGHHNTDRPVIVVTQQEVADGTLIKILKKAKKGTVIIIKGAGKFVNGAVKGVTRPLRPNSRRPDAKRPNYRCPEKGVCPNLYFKALPSKYNCKKGKCTHGSKCCPKGCGIDTSEICGCDCKAVNKCPKDTKGKCTKGSKVSHSQKKNKVFYTPILFNPLKCQSTVHRELPNGNCSCDCGGLYH